MDEPSYYGFPTYGEAGPKAAQDVGGEECTVETRSFEVNPAAHARVRRFLEQYLPGAVGPDIVTKTCIYTLTPERDFVLDRLPDHPGVALALGAGHGFKFASVLGRILAELVLDGATPSAREIEAFKVDRPLLLQERPAANFTHLTPLFSTISESDAPEIGTRIDVFRSYRARRPCRTALR